MKTFTKLGHWLPVEAWLDKNIADAFDKAGRHDVPAEVQQHDYDGKPVFKADGAPVMVEVARDLRDEKSRWWGAKGGGRLAGHVLVEDMTQGSQTVVAPVMLMLLTVFSVCVAIFQTIDGAVFTSLAAISALAVIALMVLLWDAIGRVGIWRASAFSILVPYIGVKTSLAGESMLGPVAGMGMSGGSMGTMLGGTAIALAVGAFLVYGFLGDRDSTKSTLISFAKLAALFGVAAYGSSFLPGFLQPLVWASVGCYVPLWNERMLRRARAFHLGMLATEFSGDDGTMGNSNLLEREKQALAVEKDKSGFIELGTGMGIFTRYGDGLAPDKGLPVGLSPKDLGTHLHILGETGGGKTFNGMMVLAHGWILMRAGGLLVLDGKGSLPAAVLAALVGLPNVLLIQPGVRLGLFEGLTPHDVGKALSDIAGAKKQEQDANSDAFFNNHGKSLSGHLATILDAIVRYNKLLTKSGGQREYFWTLSNFNALLTVLQEETPEGLLCLDKAKLVAGTTKENNDAFNEKSKDVNEAMVWEYGDAGVSILLQDAINYIELNYWRMPNDTRGSITALVQSWIAPLMAHEELRPWADEETGVDPTICLRGGYVGMCLPEFLYGDAGKLCQSFIRHRVMAGIRRRVKNKNWREEGQTPVLFVVDEAQEMVTQADRDFLAVAREHGGACVYGTQSYSEYESRMGKAATDAFLANFLSQMVLPSTMSHATYEYISKRMPEGEFITWDSGGSGRVIGFAQTLKKLGNHPLFDDNHPMRKEFRKLRRKGAGQLRVPKRFQVLSAKQTDHYHDMSEVDNVSHLHTPITVSGKKEVRPLLMLQDCAKYLNPQTAVVQLKRGGNARRDFIKFPILDDAQLKEREKRVQDAVIFNHVLNIIEQQIKDAAGSALTKTELHNRAAVFVMLLTESKTFKDDALADIKNESAMGRLNHQLTDAGNVTRALAKDADEVRSLIAQQWVAGQETLKKAA